MGERYGDGDLDVAPLGQPLPLPFSGRTAPNRFLKAAMTERLASWSPTDLPARGVPSPTLIRAYQRWADGGFGTILTGNTSPYGSQSDPRTYSSLFHVFMQMPQTLLHLYSDTGSPLTRSRPVMIEFDQLEAAGNAIITRQDGFTGARFEAFQAMAAAGKSNGGLMIGQVSHPGRQTASHMQPYPVSASDVRLEGQVLGQSYAKPRALTAEGIADIVDAFAHAAEFLHKAGFDGIQLHGAHGYLLSQFLSPTTNQRTDEYGGSLENRARIIFEIVRAIQERVPRCFSIGIKVNSVEFQEKGFDVNECRELCARLEAHAVDFVELSGGTYQELAFAHRRESSRKREAFFLDFADTIVPALTRTRTFVTGGLRSVGAMLRALETVDGVGLGRPACQEPDFPNEVLKGGVTGSKKWLLAEDDFGMTNVAAGTLIKLSGRDVKLLDMGLEQDVETLKRGMKVWRERQQKDEERKEFGFIEPRDLQVAA